jgi:hypothetical protein
MIDSSWGSLKIQTFRKLPTMAPNIMETILNIGFRLRLRLKSPFGKESKGYV